jgi:hypothetical protein
MRDLGLLHSFPMVALLHRVSSQLIPVLNPQEIAVEQRNI